MNVKVNNNLNLRYSSNRSLWGVRFLKVFVAQNGFLRNIYKIPIRPFLMIDLKDHLKNTRGAWKIPFFPNYYFAKTINDFLENIDEIKSTKTLLPPGVFLYGSAVINFKPSVIFNEIGILNGRMSDLSSSFEFDYDYSFLSLQEKKPLKNGDRIYDLTIVYSPKKEEISILDYDFQGPIVPEKSLVELEEKLKLGFDFG